MGGRPDGTHRVTIFCFKFNTFQLPSAETKYRRSSGPVRRWPHIVIISLFFPHSKWYRPVSRIINISCSNAVTLYAGPWSSLTSLSLDLPKRLPRPKQAKISNFEVWQYTTTENLFIRKSVEDTMRILITHLCMGMFPYSFSYPYRICMLWDEKYFLPNDVRLV